MVLVFREVHRVLRDDGTLWLNYGDTYGGQKGSGFNTNAATGGGNRVTTMSQESLNKAAYVKTGLSSGNLCGVPWRVALALQADGWILRQDIIWHKPSPMPESVTNRCTKAHEYVFLLTKSNKYFYDAEAVKEKNSETNDRGNRRVFRGGGSYTGGNSTNNSSLKPNEVPGCDPVYAGRNRRSVWPVDDGGLMQWLAEHAPEKLQEYLDETGKLDTWRVSSQGFKGAHFATFPPKLIEPMILAGTSELGCCAACGEPNRRIVDKQKLTRERPNDYVKRAPEPTQRYKDLHAANPHVTHGIGSPNAKAFSNSMQLKPMNTCSNSVAGVSATTVGWSLGCGCNAEDVPCTVLDPFVGSGCTAMVANKLGRRAIGIDLSEEYLREHAIRRIETGK